MQYYAGREPPPEVFVDLELADAAAEEVAWTDEVPGPAGDALDEPVLLEGQELWRLADDRA
mgnify:CR=1 FL=1